MYNSPMTETTIRLANVTDAESLAELADRTFRDTFAKFNDPADMDAYVSDALTTERFAEEIDDAANVWFVAEVDGELAGYAKVRAGTAHESVTGEAPIEVSRLYAEQRFHGHGVGRALIEACFDEARRQNAKTIWLGVWEHNVRAIAFYQKHGFVRCGATTFVLGKDVQTDDVMSRSL
ncbi:MAG: GNAT family N-acetyltransferase [Blastocatellia bacterium]|nr:GNAT family N-acetyltransferase [Blastocatellia bacterium]